MSFTRYILLSVIALAVIVFSCNVLKKDDPTESIQVFLNSFQSSLALSDEEILKKFDAKQSPESILAAIRILQNKESQYFECVASFQDAAILNWEGDIVKVSVATVFNSKNLGEKTDPVQSAFTLSLEKRKNAFTIIKIEAEKFYTDYATLKNQMEWRVQEKEAIEARRTAYQKAKELEPNYDTVAWFSTYRKKNYYYVVNGEWKVNRDDRTGINPNMEFTMGLVDESGSVIIPLEYQLIGAIGFDLENTVEVRKDNKVGYFNIEMKSLVVEVLNDMIIPYGKGDVLAVVKRDTLYGWIDQRFEYHEGFPNEDVEKWVNGFGFLPGQVKISASQQGVCEIPAESHAGFGILIPPSYLVRTGLFDEMITGLSTTGMPLNGWTDYVETSGTFLEKITDKVNAVVTTINQRYLEGREEFYSHKRLVFVDANNNPITVSNIGSDEFIHIKRMSDSLIEVKSVYTSSDYEMDGLASLSVYTYFSLNEDMGVTQLESNRGYPFTEFVKLDSTYLRGTFYEWNNEADDVERFSFAPLGVLKTMRDEILAGYGFIFPEERDYPDRWYKPRYKTIEEFQDQLTEIDKHNLEFLERIISLMQTESA